MSEKGRFIDLKEEESYIEQYVSLRNSYTEFLLTSPVNVIATREWLKKNDIEIKGFVEGNTLLGAAILYLNRGGEIAVFVKDIKKGIGSKLLNAIEQAAIARNLSSIWAWVLSSNLKAQKVFARNGYILEDETERSYNSKIVRGFVFRKKLMQGFNQCR